MSDTKEDITNISYMVQQGASLIWHVESTETLHIVPYYNNDPKACIHHNKHHSITWPITEFTYTVYNRWCCGCHFWQFADYGSSTCLRRSPVAAVVHACRMLLTSAATRALIATDSPQEKNTSFFSKLFVLTLSECRLARDTNVRDQIPGSPAPPR